MARQDDRVPCLCLQEQTLAQVPQPCFGDLEKAGKLHQVRVWSEGEAGGIRQGPLTPSYQMVFLSSQETPGLPAQSHTCMASAHHGPPSLPAQPLICSVASVVSNCMDCTLPGSSVHGILQARILEWVAMPFSAFNIDTG